MTADVTITPEVVEVLIENDATEVTVDAGQTILDISFDTTDIEIVVGEGVQDLQIDPVEIVVENAEIEVAIFSDIAPGSGGGGPVDPGTVFLATPDLIDETDATYFYFGWTNVDGGWLVRRQVRLNAQTLDAAVAFNPGYADLAAAWPNRDSLLYG